MNQALKKSHANIYEFIAHLKERQEANELDRATFSRQKPVPTKYRTQHRKLMTLKTRVADREISWLKFADDAGRLIKFKGCRNDEDQEDQ